MAILTEEDLDNISKALDIPKEKLRNMTEGNMTEEEVVIEFELAVQKVKLEIEAKNQKIAFLRIENIKLQIQSVLFRLESFAQQVRIGCALVYKDVEIFLRGR